MDALQPKQLLQQLNHIAHYGKNEDGSYTRLCFSDEYFKSVNAVKEILEALDMNPVIDSMGNVSGILPGTDPEAPHILTGSHLDTVPCGGLFDGAYGVAAALHAAKTMRSRGIRLRHSLEIWGFNAEEANPMGGTFGSRAIAGLCDPNSVELTCALAQFGRTPDDLNLCRRDFSHDACYLELHIEQGPMLEKRSCNIGIVSGIVGLRRYQITAYGQSNHAGTTHMSMRRDAMVAMAKLIVASTEAARRIDDALVLTVGTLSIEPGSPAVIPSKVSCCFEMRHLDTQIMDKLYETIRELCTEIPDAHFEIIPVVDKLPTRCDSRIMNCISQSCAINHYSHMILPSGATHDAVSMGRRLPVGMIFIPSKNGISHSKEEWSHNDDLERGAQVLLDTLLKLDQCWAD